MFTIFKKSKIPLLDRNLLLLPPLTGTWLGFGSGAITGAIYGILTKLRTVSPGPWAQDCQSVVCICSCPNLDILGVKFDSRLTFEGHMRGIVSRVSQIISILRLVKSVFVDSSVLLRWYYALVQPIFEYCSPVWGLLLNLIFSYSSVWCIRGPWGLCPDQTFLPLCHWRHVAALCMLYKVNTNSNHSLFSGLSSASIRVRHTWTAAAAYPLEFEVSSCRTSKFARWFLSAQTRVWNDLPCTVFDTGTLDGFMGAANRWLLPWVCFWVFRGAGACGAAKAIYKQFCFSHLGLCCWF